MAGRPSPPRIRAGAARPADPFACIDVLRIELIAVDAHEVDREAVDQHARLDRNRADGVARPGLNGDDPWRLCSQPAAERFAIVRDINRLHRADHVARAELAQAQLQPDQHAAIGRRLADRVVQRAAYGLRLARERPNHFRPEHRRQPGALLRRSVGRLGRGFTVGFGGHRRRSGCRAPARPGRRSGDRFAGLPCAIGHRRLDRRRRRHCRLRHCGLRQNGNRCVRRRLIGRLLGSLLLSCDLWRCDLLRSGRLLGHELLSRHRLGSAHDLLVLLLALVDDDDPERHCGHQSRAEEQPVAVRVRNRVAGQVHRRDVALFHLARGLALLARHEVLPLGHDAKDVIEMKIAIHQREQLRRHRAAIRTDGRIRNGGKRLVIATGTPADVHAQTLLAVMRHAPFRPDPPGVAKSPLAYPPHCGHFQQKPPGRDQRPSHANRPAFRPVMLSSQSCGQAIRLRPPANFNPLWPRALRRRRRPRRAILLSSTPAGRRIPAA